MKRRSGLRSRRTHGRGLTVGTRRGSPGARPLSARLMTMTELLSRHRRPTTPDPSAGRPLAVNAALAAVAAVGGGVLACWLVALVGWFASDGGAHGESTSALKVGTGAWLLAHGSDLHLDTAVVTAVPLGLTALCLWAAWRAARWAGATAEVEDLSSLGLATVVMAGTYGSLALCMAVLTTTSVASPDPFGAFLGGALVGALGGGAGLALGSGLRPELRALLPGHARAVLFGGAVGVLAVWSAGALLAAVTVAVRGESVANVLARLHVDVAGGFFSLLLVVLIAPNLAMWGSSYLLGGGFALGTDTIVAPSGVVTGPVPAVPVLAAVPDSGASPSWVIAVLAVPVASGLLVGWAVTRRFPTTSYRWATGRAVGAAVLAALVLLVLAAWSGGSVGSGRMREMGPDLSMVLVMAGLTLSIGALSAAAGTVWWRGRAGTATQTTDAELGLERRLPWRDHEAANRRSQVRRTRRARLQARRRGLPDDGVPTWARLGVWGASTSSPTGSDAGAQQPPARDTPAGHDGQGDEDTSFLSR